MSLLSSTPTPFHVPNKLNIPTTKPPNFLSPPPLLPEAPKPISTKLQSISTSTTPTTPTPTPTTPHPHPSWAEFGERASGEWDGVGADFTAEGSAVELPENVVPDAFREWEVKVFDWQTQCPTLASGVSFDYKLIRLLPTVGCEADAATRHSVDERTADAASAFGYARDGCYVAVWPLAGSGVEVEHCLVDPRNGEGRVRVAMVAKEGLVLEGIRVFLEHRYGPWRNGEDLGGCAIRETGFAEGPKVDVAKVVGAWEGTRVSLAQELCGEGKDVFHELVEVESQKKFRDQSGLVALPKNLWCSFKEEDGETCWEVGWLFDDDRAMTSRCVLWKDGRLKEMTIGEEIAVSVDL